MSTQIKSTLPYIKQPDGSYDPVFYINTGDDVYVDIEKSTTLNDMITDGTIRNKIHVVDNDSARFSLTKDMVKLHDLVNVTETGLLYEIINVESLMSSFGYKLIVLKDDTFAKNYLNNWDFLNPVNPTNRTTYTGIGTFLPRWKSTSNDITVGITDSGINITKSSSSTSVDAGIVQYISRDVVDFYGKQITFSIFVGNGIARSGTMVVAISRVLRGVKSNVSYVPYSKSESRNVYDVTAYINGIYDELAFEVRFDSSGEGYTHIKKAKVELGPKSTLSIDEVADKAEEAYKCSVITIDGDYVGTNTIAMAESSVVTGS